MPNGSSDWNCEDRECKPGCHDNENCEPGLQCVAKQCQDACKHTVTTGTTSRGYQFSFQAEKTVHAEIVQRFVPPQYPWGYCRVAIGFDPYSLGNQMHPMSVVFYKETSEGLPGSLIAAFPTTLSSSTPTVDEYFSFDIHTDAPEIDAGGVFVGVRWEVQADDLSVPVDFRQDSPANTAYWRWLSVGENNWDAWSSIKDTYSGFKALPLSVSGYAL